LMAFNAQLIAQSTVAPCLPAPGFSNGSFETHTTGGTGCVWTTNSFATQKISPFNQGCVSGWFAANGTPNLFQQVFGNFPASPAAGSVFAGLAIGGGNPCFNEVLATNVSLDPAYTYELSFSYRATTAALVSSISPFTGSVVVTSGLSNHASAAGMEPCISTEGSNVLSIGGINNTTWTTASVTFTPLPGQSQIAFIPSNNNGTSTSYWLIDNVVLRRCTPCKASFNVIYCAQPNSCIYTFYNTSTPSTGASIVSYTWTVTALNDPEQPVFTSTDKHLVFAPSCNGAYKICLKIRDSKGCENEYCQTIQVNCTACTCVPGPNPCIGYPPNDTVRVKTQTVTLVEPKSTYRLYPNPAKSQFQLEYVNDNPAPAKLVVVNASGQEVINRPLNHSSGVAERVQVNQLQKGLYFVKVVQSGIVVFTDKVLVAD
jgi:hypothetical protein